MILCSSSQKDASNKKDHKELTPRRNGMSQENAFTSSHNARIATRRKGVHSMMLGHGTEE